MVSSSAHSSRPLATVVCLPRFTSCRWGLSRDLLFKHSWARTGGSMWLIFIRTSSQFPFRSCKTRSHWLRGIERAREQVLSVTGTCEAAPRHPLSFPVTAPPFSQAMSLATNHGQWLFHPYAWFRPLITLSGSASAYPVRVVCCTAFAAALLATTKRDSQPTC